MYPSRSNYLHRILTILAYVQNTKTRMLRGLNTIKGKAEKNGGGLVTQSCPILAAPWTAAHQAPLPIRFLRQEYESGQPFPSPGDLPDPGIRPWDWIHFSCTVRSILSHWATWEAHRKEWRFIYRTRQCLRGKQWLPSFSHSTNVNYKPISGQMLWLETGLESLHHVYIWRVETDRI